MTRTNLTVKTLFAPLALAALVGTAPAGPLTPAVGPVASTMKTVAEVEPRTAINATNTPGDATSMFRITQPGSYYLAGDVSVASGKSGIRIDVSDVSIDLNGFMIKGVAGSSSGVIGSGLQRVTVRNGRIAATGSGISISSAGTSHQAITLEDLVISQCTGNGISIGNGSLSNCVVERCGGIGAHLSNNADSVIDRCTFYKNSSFGLNMFSGTVRGSTASSNGEAGLSISTGTITGCTANENIAGILIEAGIVTDSTLQNNTTVGIRANGNCLIRGNSVSADSMLANTIGIQVQNTTGTRIEGNQIVRMTTGINCLTASNLIIGNSFRGCTNAVNVAANNRMGTIVIGTASAATIGNTGGGLGTTDPFANVIH